MTDSLFEVVAEVVAVEDMAAVIVAVHETGKAQQRAAATQKGT